MVEFALAATVFLTVLLSIMDFGRILFIWNAAVEATRWGARTAVVCNKATPDQIRSQMRKILPQLANANIVINYFNPEGVVNNSCTPANCKAVEVSIANFDVQPISPFIGVVLPPVPPFQTYLPRESMEDVNGDGDQNPVCFL
ncbi:MAG: TadE/TadG family type IV pilus assembly protein [Burkholderiales bacterium]